MLEAQTPRQPPVPQFIRLRKPLHTFIVCTFVATMITFCWSEAKRTANLRKHGIDFRDAHKVFAGFTLTAEDDREAYGERRFLTLGLLEDKVVSVAHTEDDDEIRIISIRKATKNEARFYLSQILD